MTNITKIQTLGAFSIQNPEKGELSIGSKKNKGLLGYICTKPGLSIAREQVLSLLWSDRSRDQAVKSLRTELYKLRKECNEFDPSFLKIDRYTIALVREHVLTDISQFEDYLACNSTEDLVKAIKLYKGDFLESLHIVDPEFEEWVDVMRQKYRNIYYQLLSRLLTKYLKKDNRTEILNTAQTMLEINPIDEFAHRSLMYLYFLEEDTAKAIFQYQQCKDSLKNLLNVAPSNETQELFQKITSASSSRSHINEVLPRSSVDPEIENGLSVAILPFTQENNVGEISGGDVSDLLLSAMSKYKWLSVPPKRTTLVQVDKFDDPVDIGKALETKYILDGSIRNNPRGITVTIELTQISAKKVVWREPYTIDHPDELEPMISKIVNQVEVRLRYNEVKRITIAGANENSAYECLIKGIANMYHTSYTDFPVAKKSFETARLLAPDYPIIYTWTTLWQIFCFGQGWVSEPAVEGQRMEKNISEAIERDPDEGLSLAIGGHVASFVNHDFDKAVTRFEKSLSLNPHIAFSWMLSSATYSYMGQTQEALKRIAYAESLRPIEPHFEFMYSSAWCIAHTFAKDYEAAVDYGRKTVSSNRSFSNGYKQLIVPLVQTGMRSEAKTLANTLLEQEPGFSISRFRNSYPFSADTLEDQEIFIDSLRIAGIPMESKNKGVANRL